MYNILKICISKDISVRKALELLDLSGRHILLVVDEEEKLIGTITDGDIRRSLLKGISLDDTIDGIYNNNPRFCREKDGRQEALKLMSQHSLDQIPVLSDDGKIVKLEHYNANYQGVKIPNYVVIMAGGLGTRLGSITQTIPKALTPIAEKPILEIIINRFVNQGFSNFIICVNHKKEMIKGYFKDGSQFNAKITYIEEEKKLGTAGALGHIDKDLIQYPCLVSNCDVLTNENFQNLLETHEKENALITVGSRKFSFDIPYGVLDIQNQKLKKIDEKPSFEYNVNGGVYVLDPHILNLVPKDTYFDMTDLIELTLKQKMNVSTYTLNGYWIDIGKMEDLEKARADYESFRI